MTNDPNKQLLEEVRKLRQNLVGSIAWGVVIGTFATLIIAGLLAAGIFGMRSLAGPQ